MSWIRRTFSSSASLMRWTGARPVPKTEGNVEEFLGKIGRNCAEYASKFKSFEELMRAKREELVEMGVDVKRRKYILRWIDFYKHGIEPYEIPLKAKSPRGPKWRY